MSKPIDTLNDLIETCKDGEYGFQACAEHAKAADLRMLLENRAVQCRSAAAELQQMVADLGGTPDTGGSAIGAMHRGWVAVRTALSTFDDLAVLQECERGEDSALKAYRDALKEELPEPARSLVQRQYEGAKRNHDQIRTLRDTLKVRA